MIPQFNSPKNWTEDYPHENGNYICHCIKCNESFFGHKRRVICKECYNSKEDIKAKNKDLFGEDIPNVYFKSTTTSNDNGFMQCACGKAADGLSYVVTTNMLKADEVPEECCDAKSFSELVAKLLNEYYNK